MPLILGGVACRWNKVERGRVVGYSDGDYPELKMGRSSIVSLLAAGVMVINQAVVCGCLANEVRQASASGMKPGHACCCGAMPMGDGCVTGEPGHHTGRSECPHCTSDSMHLTVPVADANITLHLMVTDMAPVVWVTAPLPEVDTLPLKIRNTTDTREPASGGTLRAQHCLLLI
jgi:hypothetical protein